MGRLRRKPHWPAVLALAEKHGVTGILAERAGKLEEPCVPQDVRRTLQEKRKGQLLFSMSLNAELFRLLEKFSKAGLEALVMKGPVLSVRAYGAAGMRRYEDLDLLVRQRDILRFTELLAAEGYEPKVPADAILARRVPGEYVFRWPDTPRRIELHTEKSLRYFPRQLPVENLFAKHVFETVDGHDVPALRMEDELVVICVHNAKHFWERLMWAADVAGMIARRGELHWGRASATAQEVGAERMLTLGVLLASRIYGVRIPEKMEKLVRADRGAGRMGQGIIQRLPFEGGAQLGLSGRALFRMRMRGELFSGMGYLLRLTLSPTEEDWGKNKEEGRSRILEALLRPLRLTQKYWWTSRE